MTHQEFVFWLKGYLQGIGGMPTEDNMKVIEEKLALTQTFITHGITIPLVTNGVGLPDPNFTVTCSDSVSDCVVVAHDSSSGNWSNLIRPAPLKYGKVK